MIVLNKMHHSDEQWSALAKEPDDGPVFMINPVSYTHLTLPTKG